MNTYQKWVGVNALGVDVHKNSGCGSAESRGSQQHLLIKDRQA